MRKLTLYAAVLAALSVCRVDAAQITVLSSNGVREAVSELVPQFEKATGSRVTLVFGSTGNFAHQIRQGGPADVFFAADQSFVDALIAEGALLRATRTLYAQGRIVLATARVFGPKLTELRGLLDPRVRHVAIANPLHAPYGRAAEQTLRNAGLWEALRPKLVFGENIRHTLQIIQTGAAEAGIVALSVADVPEIDWVRIDATAHAPLDQAAAVVRRSPRPELGVAFIQFVNGAEGRPIMKRFGFMLPGEF